MTPVEKAREIVRKCRMDPNGPLTGKLLVPLIEKALGEHQEIVDAAVTFQAIWVSNNSPSAYHKARLEFHDVMRRETKPDFSKEPWNA